MCEAAPYSQFPLSTIFTLYLLPIAQCARSLGLIVNFAVASAFYHYFLTGPNQIESCVDTVKVNENGVREMPRCSF